MAGVGVSRGFESWMGTPCAAGTLSITVPWSWALALLLAPPHWAPSQPLHGKGGHGRGDISALCFSSLSSESGSSLENGYTNHTASLEGLPSLVVLFCRALVSHLVVVVGFRGCLNDSGPESDACGVRTA